jgi:AraC-like DNA-binding protein
MNGTPLDAIVFTSPSVHIGAFRCPVGHESFADSGPIRNHCFVFPRTAVVIRHKDQRPFPSDPTIATLYNKGQEYRREPLSPEGDLCDWYAVTADVLRDALAGRDPRAADDERRPIRFPFARIDADTYLLQRRLFAAASRSQACRERAPGAQASRRADPLYVEETVYELLDRVLAAAYASGWTPYRRRRAVDDLAAAACQVVGRRFREQLTVADIAADVGCSRYHLCRTFKASTGTTLHAYRDQLRLRSALNHLESPSVDLTRLALDLGYSSHSHFTASFRRAFGVTPSAARNITATF